MIRPYQLSHQQLFLLLLTDTPVMTVIATDADEPGNMNSKIAYTIVDQKPAHGMFYITREGIIKVKKDTLDREVKMKCIPLLKTCSKSTKQ